MAKKGKLSPSANTKINYKAYGVSNKYEKNRIKKLERHTNNYPEDENATNTLNKFLSKGVSYRRNNRGHGANPKQKSEEKQAVVSEMLKRYLKSLKREVPEYVKLLQGLGASMKPTVKYRKRRGKRKTVPQGS